MALISPEENLPFRATFHRSLRCGGGDPETISEKDE